MRRLFANMCDLEGNVRLVRELIQDGGSTKAYQQYC